MSERELKLQQNFPPCTLVVIWNWLYIITRLQCANRNIYRKWRKYSKYSLTLLTTINHVDSLCIPLCGIGPFTETAMFRKKNDISIFGELNIGTMATYR